jgi:hypothetical protein
MEKWEYKIVGWPRQTSGNHYEDSNEVAEALCNQLGTAGWELVEVVTRVSGGSPGYTSSSVTFVFKRRKQ